MSTFLQGTLLFLVIGLVINLPLTILAQRRGRKKLLMRSLLVVLAVAMCCGAMQFGAERLTNQCLANGNPTYNCNSYGEAGMQALFVVGLAIFSWLNAFWLRDSIR